MTVEIDENEAVPDLEGELFQAGGRGIESRMAFHARRPAQTPVKTVDPGVIGAGDDSLAPSPFENLHPAVTADVREDPETSLLIADHGDRRPDDLAGKVAARFADLVGPADGDPSRSKDPLDFKGMNVRVAVRVGRQRHPAGIAVCRHGGHGLESGGRSGCLRASVTVHSYSAQIIAETDCQDNPGARGRQLPDDVQLRVTPGTAGP